MTEDEIADIENEIEALGHERDGMDALADRMWSFWHAGVNDQSDVAIELEILSERVTKEIAELRRDLIWAEEDACAESRVGRRWFAAIHRA